MRVALFVIGGLMVGFGLLAMMCGGYVMAGDCGQAGSVAQGLPLFWFGFGGLVGGGVAIERGIIRSRETVSGNLG